MERIVHDDVVVERFNTVISTKCIQLSHLRISKRNSNATIRIEPVTHRGEDGVGVRVDIQHSPLVRLSKSSFSDQSVDTCSSDHVIVHVAHSSVGDVHTISNTILEQSHLVTLILEERLNFVRSLKRLVRECVLDDFPTKSLVHHAIRTTCNTHVDRISTNDVDATDGLCVLDNIRINRSAEHIDLDHFLRVCR